MIAAGFADNLSWLLMMVEGEVIRAVMLDIAGVLYEGDRPVSGARQAFGKLVASGLPLRLVTNSTRRTKRALIERLLRMGFDVAPEDLFTAPAAAREYLKEKSLTIFPLIHPALEEEFTDFSAARPNAVLVIGSFTPTSTRHSGCSWTGRRCSPSLPIAISRTRAV